VTQLVRGAALHAEVRADQHVDHDAAAAQLQAQRFGHEGNAVRQHQHRGVARGPAVLLEARVEQADLRTRRIVFLQVLPGVEDGGADIGRATVADVSKSMAPITSAAKAFSTGPSGPGARRWISSFRKPRKRSLLLLSFMPAPVVGIM